jgi:hypothetical protein
VVLRRDEVRQLVLSSPIPQPIEATFDLRDPRARTDPRRDGAARRSGAAVIRVIGNPVQDAGLLIEITLETLPLRAAMIDYGLRILILSAVISIVTPRFCSLRCGAACEADPRVVGAMQSYAAAPEDARRIIEPQAG